MDQNSLCQKIGDSLTFQTQNTVYKGLVNKNDKEKLI